jgi:hypothetical protein
MVDIAGIRRIYYGDDEPPPVNGTGYDADLQAMLLDWPAFWGVDRTEAEWLAEPIIPAKRSVAMFAPGGTGKSLLALWLAAALATGRPIFGKINPPIDVLYLDYEMTEDDLHERLESMGYDTDSDLTRFHYALLPSLPALDEPEGGKAILRLAQLCDAALVVIDTFGRAVHGDENLNDTVRAWYRWSGIHLKAEGRAFVRVDHAGKDLTKGQRGGSAKNDDVDIVWQMIRQDGDVFELKATKRRMSWVPEKVELHLDDDDDLRYALLSGGISYPAGTADVAHSLDKLGVDPMASGNAAQKALREAGYGARRVLVLAAQKYRKGSGTTPGTTLEPIDREPPSEPPEAETANPLHTPSGTTSGTTGNQGVRQMGGGVPTYRWEPPPAGSRNDPDPDPEEPLF